MKTHLEHKFLSVQQKMSAIGKPSRGRARILTDSGRKRNRKEVLANHKLGNKSWTLH